MKDTSISINALSKKYTLGKTRELTFSSFFKDLLSNKNIKQDFWALKNINVKILRGEKVGIIGKNGAGKSTLLKILSRVTSPTSGTAVIYGRLISLLEVGTGFHPELTGRENIILNGSILGMSKKELLPKIPDIVNFAEINNFIDYPIKKYSTGMRMRLAFAVATFLDFDILMIDEVLTVGDIAFQRKCVDRLKHLANLDITLIVVSHNFNLISQLCTKCILLENGKINKIATTSEVLQQLFRAKLFEKVDLKDLKINNIVVNNGNEVYYGQSFSVNLLGKSFTDVNEIGFVITVFNAFGQIIFQCNSQRSNEEFRLEKGLFDIEFNVKHLPLFSGKYFLGLSIAKSGKPFYSEDNILNFDVINNKILEKEHVNKIGVMVDFDFAKIPIDLI